MEEKKREKQNRKDYWLHKVSLKLKKQHKSINKQTFVFIIEYRR